MACRKKINKSLNNIFPLSIIESKQRYKTKKLVMSEMVMPIEKIFSCGENLVITANVILTTNREITIARDNMKEPEKIILV